MSEEILSLTKRKEVGLRSLQFMEGHRLTQEFLIANFTLGFPATYLGA